MFGQEINLFHETAQVPPPIKGMRAAHLYPSSASVKVKTQTGAEKVYGGCLRSQYLRFLGEAPSDIEKDDESLGVWLAGNQIQDVIEGRWKLGGVFVQSELPVYLKDYNASGRIDPILHKVQPDGTSKLFGVEVKSKCGYYAETHFINPNSRVSDIEFRPSDDHILQSMVYMHACRTLPHLKDYNITKWLIAYILRDNYKWNYFELELTDDSYKKGYGYPIIYSKVKPEGFIYSRFRVQDILDRWDQLNHMLSEGILPERDFLNIYSNELLQRMAADGELSATNQKHVAAGKFNYVNQEVRGVKEPMGDKACAYCDFRSKCWGLGKYEEGQFGVINKET